MEPESTEMKSGETSFTDSSGIVWIPEVNIPVIRKACRVSGLSLIDIFRFNIPIDALFSILWCAYEKQALKRNLSEEEFLNEVVGLSRLADALVALANAFCESLPEAKEASGPFVQAVKMKLKKMGTESQ